MGNICPCFKGDYDSGLITPDADTRRRQQAMAAEKRIQEQENRGIKNPENVKRAQAKALERERMENSAGSGANNLRWAQD